MKNKIKADLQRLFSSWVGDTSSGGGDGTVSTRTTGLAQRTFYPSLVLMWFSIVQFFSFAYDNIHVRRPPLKERSVLYQRTGGHRPPRPIKTRAATKYFNNEWQKGRYLQVENLGFVEACEQRGIQVLKPEAIFTSHLPGVVVALFL